MVTSKIISGKHLRLHALSPERYELRHWNKHMIDITILKPQTLPFETILQS